MFEIWIWIVWKTISSTYLKGFELKLEGREEESLGSNPKHKPHNNQSDNEEGEKGMVRRMGNSSIKQEKQDPT